MRLRIFITCAVALMVSSGCLFASGINMMPNFGAGTSAWYVDRYAPASFTVAPTYEGANNVLQIGINSTGNSDNRPSGEQDTFYNTQGMGYTVSGATGDIISALLYIPTAWSNPANGDVRTDMWGVEDDSSGNVADYPTIGFTNYGAAGPTLRYWDDQNGVWNNIAMPIQYNAWTRLTIVDTGYDSAYFVNGTWVGSSLINSSDPPVSINEVILQAYNFNDPTLSPLGFSNAYTANWANAPEPAGFALMGGGLLALVFVRRRRLTAKRQ